MRLHTCAGFGELITPPWLERVKKVATGVRQEIPNGAHHPDVERLVAEISSRQLEATILINGWMWIDPETGRVWQDKKTKPEPEHVGAFAVESEAKEFAEKAFGKLEWSNDGDPFPWKDGCPFYYASIPKDRIEPDDIEFDSVVIERISTYLDEAAS